MAFCISGNPSLSHLLRNESIKKVTEEEEKEKDGKNNSHYELVMLCTTMLTKRKDDGLRSGRAAPVTH